MMMVAYRWQEIDEEGRERTGKNEWLEMNREKGRRRKISTIVPDISLDALFQLFSRTSTHLDCIQNLRFGIFKNY